MKFFTTLAVIVSVQINSIAQNVGIGTNTPAEKLHVAGNIKGDTVKPGAIKFPPNAGAGKVLTSDATGNASWQEKNAGGGAGFGGWGDCATNTNISGYQPFADTAAGVFGGNSCSVSGSFAIIGTPNDNIGLNTGQGSVSFFKHNGSEWELMQKVSDPLGSLNQNFGWSVSISGNYAIVGAWNDSIGGGKGSAIIYNYNGSSWVPMQKLTDATGSPSDYFGRSVSISGNYAIVGAWWDDVGANTDQGSASIFQYNGSSWVLMQKITDATGDAFDYYGGTVSISGNYAIVGSLLDDESLTEQGSASIYRYNGSNWVLMQKLVDATGDTNDEFGFSVSISGNYAVVGARSDDVGPNFNQGSASIYRYDGTSWILMQKVTDATGGSGDEFGYSVYISGNYIHIGAHFDNVAINLQQGASSIYFRVGNGWNKLQYVTDPYGSSGDFFGSAVCIDGVTRRFIIGAVGYGGSSGKVLFGKVN